MNSTWRLGVQRLCCLLAIQLLLFLQSGQPFPILSERWCNMSFKWDRVHVWSCEVTDQPGSVAQKLASLAQADANLEYIFTKRLPHKPGFGILYVAPVTGPAQVRAAKAANMHEADHPIV